MTTAAAAIAPEMNSITHTLVLRQTELRVRRKIRARYVQPDATVANTDAGALLNCGVPYVLADGRPSFDDRTINLNFQNKDSVT